MAVPDFQSLMRPLLEILADGKDHSIRSIRRDLANHFSLSQDDVDELIPSGRVTTLQNRVGWAATYLYRAGLIQRPRRAVYRIADRGREVLDANSHRVDLSVLSQFDEFEEFRHAKSAKGAEPATVGTADEQTPEERIDDAYRELRSALAGELIERVQDQTAEFFEQLVLDVLHAMGYGGRREDASERLGKTGDEGVDGVIREDRLGLDAIYVQAKKWSNTVGRPEIQKFVGALQGQKATKGVFIATSAFSPDAIEYADKVIPRVILVDGNELAQLMMEHDVGVATSNEYLLKRLDLDYFVIEDEDSSVEAQNASAERPISVTSERSA
jgi:restriction system protein